MRDDRAHATVGVIEGARVHANACGTRVAAHGAD
jgi:hypothetical protein